MSTIVEIRRLKVQKCNGGRNEIKFICHSYRQSSIYCCHRTLRLLLSPLHSSSMPSLLSKVNNSKQRAARDNNKPLPSAECIISLAGVRIFTLLYLDWFTADMRPEFIYLYSVSFNARRQLNQSLYRPGKALRASGGWDSKNIYRQSGMQVVYTCRLYHQEKPVVLISIRGWVDPRVTVRSEGLSQ